MIDHEVIIVGGGPAGSACAWKLRQLGIPSVVLEKEHLPRVKLCAGWITPKVVRDLEIDPATYPHRFLTFRKIHAEYFGRRGSRAFGFDTTQHSIRRCDFDHWLLERSGATVLRHEVKQVRRAGSRFVLDDQLRCRFLVGAAGSFCPVFRTFFKELNPRSKAYQVGALEQEFAYDYRDESCRLWFAENGLVGYAWYVPKGRGWLNVGLGGFSSYLRQARLSLHDHWTLFEQRLARSGLVRNQALRPRGHTYFIREPAKRGQRGRAFIVGDSAGLATRDLAEGIGPAVESGLCAAEAIATGRPYSLEGMTRYSARGAGFWSGLMDRLVDRKGSFFVDRVYARHWREKESRALGA